METLYLSGNDLEGDVPIAAFEKFSKLKTFILFSNGMGRLNPVSKADKSRLAEHLPKAEISW